MYLNCVWCFMHMTTIGLFAQHICNSIIHKINTTLRNDAFVKGSTKDGKPKYVISKASLEAVYNRLCERLQHYHSSHAGFKLTPKYTAYFKNVFLRGKGTFNAGRMQLLMLALPFALHDLLGSDSGDCTPSQGARKASNSQSGGSEHRYGTGPEQIPRLVRNGQTDRQTFPNCSAGPL